MTYQKSVLATNINECILFIKQEGLTKFAVQPAKKIDIRAGNNFILFYNK
jgi:hypothetical protein